MTQELIESKLENLSRCIQRIESKKPFSIEQLKSDFDLQDIISLNIERAVQICVDLASILISIKNAPTPSTMAESFQRLEEIGLIDTHLSLRLQKSVGFRNIAVHEYEKINWEVVHKISHLHLVDLKSFGAVVSKTALSVDSIKT